MKSNSRKLKIETMGWNRKDGKRIPKIRITGQWLAALGFAPGASVIFTPIAEGMATLTVSPA